MINNNKQNKSCCPLCQADMPNRKLKAWNKKSLLLHLRMAHTLRPDEFLAIKEGLK